MGAVVFQTICGVLNQTMTGILSRKLPKKTDEMNSSVVESGPVSTSPLKPDLGGQGRGRGQCGRCLLCVVGLTVISLLLAAITFFLLLPRTSRPWHGRGLVGVLPSTTSC